MENNTFRISPSKLTIIFLVIVFLAGTFVILAALLSDAPDETSVDSTQPSAETTETPVPTEVSEPVETPYTKTPEPTQSTTPETQGPVSSPDTLPDEIDVSDLSNEKRGWWYTPGGSPGESATAPQEAIKILEENGGIWQGDTEQKKIYITMDVGYEYNNNTTRILDIALEKDFRINFFITGTILRDDAHKNLAVRMNEEGHIVGNHTWSHPGLPDLLDKQGVSGVAEELTRLADEYRKITGSEMGGFMRPPMGEYSEATTYIMKRLGYKSVFWSFAYRDWLTDDQPDKEYALELITRNLHNGSILLLHTVSDTNVSILPDLVDIIREMGYEIALLDEDYR